ncbi:MAG: hypothetical protein RRY11_04210 [Terrisporobacter sp.]
MDDYRIVVNQLFGDKTRRISDRKNVPSALFLDPAYSRVGLNIKESKAKGYNVLVAKMASEAIPRAKQIGKTEGLAYDAMYQVLLHILLLDGVDYIFNIIDVLAKSNEYT